ncbi:MAG: glutamate--tRNA ligase [Bacteroidota bacterium]
MSVVVRFAPSPTGPLHIGGVRTALYCYLFAQQQGGRFILRIEDTDRTRFVPGAEDHIKNGLNWIGVHPSEGPGIGGEHGPYRQSERAASGLYKKFADKLLAEGNAYYAFDTSEELEAMRERLKAAGSSVQQYNASTRGEMKNSLTLSAEEVQQRIDAGERYVVRMKMPENREVTFTDLVRGEVTFNTSQLDDKILLKGDGMPTYHLAVVVDDYHMGVSHIIRGEEWVSSTPLHICLYEALGWADSIPVFVHPPLILNPNGKGKMSKRQGDKLGFSVFPIEWTNPETEKYSSGFREDGFLPEAMFNFLALQGWNPGNDEEVMSKERLIELFSLERINKSPSNFDLNKLNWFNQSYIREVFSEEKLLELVKEDLAGRDLPSKEDIYLAKFIELMKERVSKISEFAEEGVYFFKAPETYNEKMARKQWKENTPDIMKSLKEKFDQAANWSRDELYTGFEQLAEEKELGKGRILAPLRLALTGVPGGPDAFEIAALLGKAETFNRIDAAIEKLGA